MREVFLKPISRLLAIFIISFSLGGYAEEPVLEPAIPEAPITTRTYREKANYFALLNYSPVDLLIPGKYGLTLGLIQSPNVTWEFEYLKGSLSVPLVITNLGNMTDQRISVIRRSYDERNSLNFSYGLSYFDFSIHLGDKLLSNLSGGNYPSVDLVAVQALGLNVGIGNRWTFKRNITFGVDWFSLAQPFFVTSKNAPFLDHSSNQEDKDSVDNAVKVISSLPRLVFFKIQLGILF